MKKFCDDSMKIINFGKKKKISLTNKEYKSYLNQTNCHIYKKKGLKINTLMIKNIVELEIIVITQVNT